MCHACGRSSNKNRREFGPRGAPSRGFQHRCPWSRRATSSSAAVRGKARMHTSFDPCILQAGPQAMRVSFCYLRNLPSAPSRAAHTATLLHLGVENEIWLHSRSRARTRLPQPPHARQPVCPACEAALGVAQLQGVCPPGPTAVAVLG